MTRQMALLPVYHKWATHAQVVRSYCPEGACKTKLQQRTGEKGGMLAEQLISLPSLASVLALIGLELRTSHTCLEKLASGAAGDLVGKYIFMDFIKCSLCKHTLKNC